MAEATAAAPPTLETERLRPFVPRLAVDWLREAPGESARVYPGTLVFADVSGFTALTEKLSRRGREGAEEIAGVLDAAFGELVKAAYRYDADLLKWGGDAILLLFRRDEHALRAVAAARGMQRALESMRRYQTSAGPVRLKMSIGAHTGDVHLFLVGSVHRELVIAGADSTTTVATEAIADADEVAMSAATASLVPPELRGSAKENTTLLARDPEVEPVPPPPFDTSGVDLARLLPAEYTAELRGDPEDPEHRHVAVAFVEICETDTLLASDGPRALADALDERISAIQDSCLDHGVTFAQTDVSKNGVKAILLTGAPRSSAGDEEELLLRAAREIADAPGKLPVRIGVNSGRIFAGVVGPPSRRTYTFYGDTINTAARIMVRAEHGEILVADDVLERARTQYASERVAPFEAKGKAEPVRASALGHAIGMRMPEALGPLVGRSMELDALLSLLDEARRGAGASVVLTGDPGIGKTRLLAELGAHAFNMRWFRIQCEQSDASHSYRIAGAIMRAALSLAPSESPDETARRLREAVGALAPEIESWLPLLGVPLELELPPTPRTAHLEPRFVPERMAEALSVFLPRLVDQPALVTLDDSQWLDEASRYLLGRIAALGAASPWLWVAARREAPDSEGHDTGMTPVRVHLLPLSPDFARDLVDALTEDQPLPLHVVDELVARSGGNPLFLTQLTAAARAGGSIDELPSSVEALLASQIDELPARDRAALRQAAVLGARFELTTLLAALDLDAAEGQELLERLDVFLALDRGIVTFRHSLLREAAYEGLSYKRRRVLHRDVARALTERAGDDLDEIAGTLSYHYQEARDWPLAWKHASRAGLRAQERFALTDAVVLLDRALAVSRRVRSLETEDIVRVAEALGDVCVTLDELDRARDAYRVARRRLRGDPVRDAPLVFKQMRVDFRGGRYRQALARITRGLRALDGLESSEASAARARFLSGYAGVTQQLGRPRQTISWCERAIAEAEASGARDALAHGLYLLDWAHMSLGNQQAAIHSQRALELFEALGDLRWKAIVLNNLGMRAYYAGDWDEASRRYGEARDVFDEIGDRWLETMTTYNLAEILADQGRYEDAEPLLRGVLRTCRAAGDQPRVAGATRELAKVAARAGQAPTALSLLGEAREIFSALGDSVELVATDARIAEAHLYAGHLTRALEIGQRTLREAESLPGAAHSVPVLLRVIGSAHGGARRSAEAKRWLSRSLERAEEIDAPAELVLTLSALDCLPNPPDFVRERLDSLCRELGVTRMPVISLA